MKKYKVLAIHIGEDPQNPYVPGDEERGTRSLAVQDAKALLELGLLGELDDGDGVTDSGLDAGTPEIVVLQLTIDEQAGTIESLRGEVEDLQSRLASKGQSFDAIAADLGTLRQAHTDLVAAHETAQSDLAAAQVSISKLSKPSDEPADKTTGGKPVKTAEKKTD